MQFFTKIAAFAAAAASLASANTVTFKSQDSTSRTIYFTPNAGLQTIEPLVVAGMATVSQDFPVGWIGNWYSVSEGATNVPGMLGEVAFNGWNGITYFDVSAIVNPADHVGVKTIYAASDENTYSGCVVFPCDKAYYLPDDLQTVTTHETDLVCTLGGNGAAKRETDDQLVARKFVEGKF